MSKWWKEFFKGVATMMIFLVLIALVATAAFGQEPVAMTDGSSFLSQITSAPFLGKVLAFMLAIQIFLRGLAECLTRISVYTETTWDNKAAGWISEAAWVLGVGLGKVGVGVPKLVMEEATKAAEKKDGKA